MAIERFGFSGLVLMENAGRGVVDVLLAEDAELAQASDQPVVILCGKGNNAGDGFVIARHLANRDVGAKVILLASPSELRGDAKVNYEILTHCDVPIVDLSSTAGLRQSLTDEVAGARWLIDAMLGTGAAGEPREPFATAIHWMNEQPARRLAVDLPSGLDCDAGKTAGAAVSADVTCTFVAAKLAFADPRSQPYVGELSVVAIGVPRRVVDAILDRGGSYAS